MLKNKITQALMMSAGMAVAATSFTSFAADVPAGVKLAAKQEILRGNGAEPESLDPHKISGVTESNIARDLLETLVIQDENGKTIPGAAESWKQVDDTTYVFNLRKDGKWSNGDPVTAQDFEYSIKRVTDPATASPYAWYIEIMRLENGDEIIAGKKPADTLGVKAIDDYTLEFKLSEPVPYFVKMVGHTTVSPVHKGTVEKYGDQWTKPGNFVGNGAYTVSDWVVNERIVLERNKNYWNDAKTVINKVSYLPIDDGNAEMNRFLAGELELTSSIPPEHFKRLKKQHPESVSVVGSLCTYYYRFNTGVKPFDDARVRKALSYAINRDVVSNALLGAGQKPAYFLTPEITDGFDPVKPAYANLTQKERDAEAKKLLEAAGFSPSNPLDFTLLYNTSESHKKIAVALASMWKRLGVKVTLENQEWKTYLDTTRKGNFQVARAGWCGDYNEASTFLTLMQSTNTSGGIHYGSTDYDKIINTALSATSDEERNKLYLDAEAKLADDMPIAPIYQYVNTRLIKPSVGGFPYGNAEGNIYTKDLYLKAN